MRRYALYRVPVLFSFLFYSPFTISLLELAGTGRALVVPVVNTTPGVLLLLSDFCKQINTLFKDLAPQHNTTQQDTTHLDSGSRCFQSAPGRSPRAASSHRVPCAKLSGRPLQAQMENSMLLAVNQSFPARQVPAALLLRRAPAFSGASMSRWVAGPSFNHRVGGSIPALVDVSLSKALDPELLPEAVTTVCECNGIVSRFG